HLKTVVRSGAMRGVVRQVNKPGLISVLAAYEVNRKVRQGRRRIDGRIRRWRGAAVQSPAVVVLYVRTQEPFEQGNTGLLHHMIHTARVAKMPFAEDCHFVGRQRRGICEKLEYRRRASRQRVCEGA